MGNWAISVVGTVLLTVLADVILPDGQTNKYVKTALSVVVIVAMLTPLLKLSVNIGWISYDKEYQPQLQYLYSVEVKQEQTLEDMLSDKLVDKYGQCEVDVDATLDQDGLEINKVCVELEKRVIDSAQQNILFTEIGKTVASLCGVSEDRVEVSWQ